MAQIVITAATPMCEEADKSFPPEEEPPIEEKEEAKAKEIIEKKEEERKEVRETEPEEDPQEYGKEEDDQPADSAPFPISSSTGSEEDTYTGPSTADNSQAAETTIAKKHADSTSIPDELEPHQLARLQHLKESDA